MRIRDLEFAWEFSSARLPPDHRCHWRERTVRRVRMPTLFASLQCLRSLEIGEDLFCRQCRMSDQFVDPIAKESERGNRRNCHNQTEQSCHERFVDTLSKV